MRRPLEGSRYEGGTGFAASTWRAWAGELGLVRRFPHAYQAPRIVQIAVSDYGWRAHRGSWGCMSKIGYPP